MFCPTLITLLSKTTGILFFLCLFHLLFLSMVHQDSIPALLPDNPAGIPVDPEIDRRQNVRDHTIGTLGSDPDKNPGRGRLDGAWPDAGMGSHTDTLTRKIKRKLFSSGDITSEFTRDYRKSKMSKAMAPLITPRRRKRSVSQISPPQRPNPKIPHPGSAMLYPPLVPQSGSTEIDSPTPQASVVRQWSTSLRPGDADHDFRFDLSEPAACSGHTFLLVAVYSAPGHVIQRRAIRDTWGSLIVPTVQPSDVAILFVLGISHNATLQKVMLEESREYHDIIQANFSDTYDALTLKSIATLQWINTFCPKVNYVLKTDDDVFVNIPLLQTDLRSIVHEYFIMGDVIAGAQPIRNEQSKWFTPETVYNGTRYPKYISGSAYVISGDLVLDLYRVAKKSAFFWLEDIFITGFCAQKLNVSYISNAKIAYKKREDALCSVKKYITFHRVTPQDIRYLWEVLQSDSADCTKLKSVGLIS